MELGLKDKVAVITGASRGIGAASARALAHHGATVVVNYIKSKDKAEDLLDGIKKAGGRGMVYQADVRDQGAVNVMVEATHKEFGKIDVLVNNANINFPIRPFIELTWDQIEAKILGEMKALYNCSQAVLKDMTRRKSGKLIFISSSLSRSPGFGFSAHAAAKSAMDGMAKVMATELGPLGITVNAVCPGLIDTEMVRATIPPEKIKEYAESFPIPRLGESWEVAELVHFLVSRNAAYITGAALDISGGDLMV